MNQSSKLSQREKNSTLAIALFKVDTSCIEPYPVFALLCVDLTVNTLASFIAESVNLEEKIKLKNSKSIDVRAKYVRFLCCRLILIFKPLVMWQKIVASDIRHTVG